MDCNSKFAEIVTGSKAEFDLILTDRGRPLDLSPFTGGNLVFKNAQGTRTVVVLAIPGSSPSSGIVPVEITSVESANADSKWANADLELTAASPSDSRIIPLNDRFKIISRNAPA